MHKIDFPEWPEVLTQADLTERVERSFEITVRWYLSFCKRGLWVLLLGRPSNDVTPLTARSHQPVLFRAAQDGQRPPDAGPSAGRAEEGVWIPSVPPMTKPLSRRGNRPQADFK